jgi:hypothetical protein
MEESELKMAVLWSIKKLATRWGTIANSMVFMAVVRKAVSWVRGC